MDGGGPLTARLSGWLWAALLHRHRSTPSHRLLSFAGVLVALISVLLWFLMIWIGWSMVFNMTPTAIVEIESDKVANLSSRIYYVGYTLITLGLGDYQPGSGFWQITTVVAAASGFFLLSLAITYLLSLVSAAVHKRQLAVYLASLGPTVDDILLRHWNGRDFGALSQHLGTLTPMLALLAQRHVAYPALFYMHDTEPRVSIALSIAGLDEALTLLKHAIEPEHRPSSAAIHPIRQMIEAFLDTLRAAYINPAPVAPPPPSLERMEASGIPTVEEDTFQEAVEELSERRRLLLALVMSDGWAWEYLYPDREIRETEPTGHETFL